MAKKKPKRRKRKLGSYPFVGVLISITLSLTLIGITGALLVHANKISDTVRNVKLQVYLNRNLNTVQLDKVRHGIAGKDYIKEDGDGKPVIKYVSEKEAVEEFVDDTGDEYRSILSGYNPIKGYIEIEIKSKSSNVNSLNTIKSEIESDYKDEVYEVYFPEHSQNRVKDINKNVNIIVYVLLGLCILCFTIVALLIINTIKLAMFSQRFLIRSMQLVGAKSSFIKKPFLINSILLGMAGGALAIVFLRIPLFYVYRFLGEFSSLEGMTFNTNMLILYGGLIVLGAIVSIFATQFALNKYLKMSLDDLY